MKDQLKKTFSDPTNDEFRSLRESVDIKVFTKAAESPWSPWSPWKKTQIFLL